MGIASILRKLAERNQFAELIEAGEDAWALEEDLAIPPLLSAAHARLGERGRAIEWLELALEEPRPFAPDILVDTAAAFIALGRLADAKQQLEAALHDEPNHALGRARLGFCFLLEGALDEARTEFERANRAGPGSLPVLANLIHLNVSQQECGQAELLLDEALVVLTELRESLPSSLFRQYWQQFHGMQIGVWVAKDEVAKAEAFLEQIYEEADPEGIDDEDIIVYVGQLVRHLAQKCEHAAAQDLLRNFIKRMPKSVALRVQLSELAHAQGRTGEAFRLLERAIKIEPENAGTWIQLARVCVLGDPKRARVAAAKAVELIDRLSEVLDDSNLASSALGQWQSAHAQTVLAQIEGQEGEFEAARERFSAILDEHPAFVPALLGLGHQELLLGHIDEAVALFERVQEVDPAQGAGALINARRFPEDEESLDRIENAARRPGLEGPVRSSLIFRLATAWEQRGEYGRAFDLVQEANEVTRPLLNYEASQHRNRCARIRASFCRELFEHRPGIGHKSKLPIFIVGMPRSGTTLVEQILAGHSRIFGAGELGVIPSLIHGLGRWERHVGSGRRYPDCVDDLTSEIVSGLAEGVLKELGELVPDTDSVDHIVDKLPHNFENVGLIKFLFPNARIISVRRDPRDIAISNYFTDFQAKFGGMGFAYDLTDIGQQLSDHNLLMHHWNKVFPGEILELRYEDVVDDLEGSARRLFDYIGVDWEPGALDFTKVDRPVKTASVWQVRQPLYRSSKEKWRHYEDRLAPLITGTNAKIEPDPEASEMITLPEPGFLAQASACMKAGDLDGAERAAKKMLHHNPEHGACRYLVGLVYLRKGHLKDGIAEIEAALESAPHQIEWRTNLVKAHRTLGDEDRAETLLAEAPNRHRRRPVNGPAGDAIPAHF